MKPRIALLTIFVFVLLSAGKSIAQVVIRDSLKISSTREYLSINPSDSSFQASAEILTTTPTYYLPCGPLPNELDVVNYCDWTGNLARFYGDSITLALASLPPCATPWLSFSYFYEVFKDQCGPDCFGQWRLFIGLRNVQFTQGTEYARVVDLYTRTEVGYTLEGLQLYQSPPPNYRIYFDKQTPQDSAIVTYEFTNPNIGATTRVSVIVVRPQFTIQKSISTSQVRHGETLSMSFDAFNQCRLKSPTEPRWRSPLLPATVTYDVSIIAGSEFGVLRNTQTGETGIALNGLTHTQGLLSSVSFVANGQQSSPLATNEVLIQVSTSDSRIEPVEFAIQILPDDLHHFELTVQPDTIAHNETATIYVQAKDVNNNDLAIPDYALLNFSLNNNGEFLGRLIAPDGSRSRTLSGISYGDARAGNVKYIADRFELTEDDALPVTITATLGASSAVSGSDVLIVAKTVVKIKLEMAAQELRPLGDVDNKKNPNFNKDGPDKRKVIADFSKIKKTTVTVKVTDGQDVPLPNYSFTIQALTRSQSGGHDHTADRLSGKFVTSAGDTSASLQGTTDENGAAAYTYLSSGIGGLDSIRVEGEDEQQTGTATIVLRMSGLQLLADGEHYNLIGAYGEEGVTSRHTVNHYGTSTLISKLQALADSVYADSSFVLRINDMSIVNGGPFDTGNNWNTPHQNHREGVSADIDDVDANGKRIKEKYLKEWLTQPSFKGDLINEVNHFHVAFR